MSDLRKAAEMALEVLEELQFINASFLKCDKAAEALRQALLQPEQEPVACIGTTGELMWLNKPKVIYNKPQPLYAAPPKREWVGLTDDELKPLCDEWQIIYGGYVRPFAETIEAKLKEKNT